MALKDLLVHMDQTPAALTRLRIGAELSRRHGSRLCALYIRAADPARLHEQSTREFGLVSAADLDQEDRLTASAADSERDLLQQQIATLSREFGVQIELRALAGNAALLLPQHARFADLCLLGQDALGNATTAGHSYSQAVLLNAGRPVVFVPAQGSFGTLGLHILVAWNSSRASTRSLNDAMPLIEQASSVTVLAVNPGQYVARYQTPPPEQIVAHLRRHCASVDYRCLEQVEDRHIAAAIQTEAHRSGADIIVAGAFGHPRLWEKLTGGVTRDLLAETTLPLLMSY